MDKLKPTITGRRRQTRNKMYRYIYEAGSPVSKQQISVAMGYSLPTVHQNIAELLEAGLIVPGDIQKSTGGRPAVGYVINEKVRYAVGIAVSSMHLRILAIDLLQNELAYESMRMDFSDGRQIGLQIAGELEAFLQENALDRGKVLGVGITFPGVINRDQDEIVHSPSLEMKGLSLRDVREPIPFPVFIENDSTSAGTAEWLALPSPEKEEDFVYLFLENGIGGAVYIGGKPYLGSGRRSGEFGHMCIVPGGRQCKCGKQGCLEAYCSAFRFTRDLGMSTEEFFGRLDVGDAACRALWDEVLEHLAIAINNLRMAFDSNVILGGYVSSFLEPHLPELRKRAAALNTFEEGADYIRLGRYPTKAVMRGVAWHFMEEFIDSI